MVSGAGETSRRSPSREAHTHVHSLRRRRSYGALVFILARPRFKPTYFYRAPTRFRGRKTRHRRIGNPDESVAFVSKYWEASIRCASSLQYPGSVWACQPNRSTPSVGNSQNRGALLPSRHGRGSRDSVGACAGILRRHVFCLRGAGPFRGYSEGRQRMQGGRLFRSSTARNSEQCDRRGSGGHPAGRSAG